MEKEIAMKNKSSTFLKEAGVLYSFSPLDGFHKYYYHWKYFNDESGEKYSGEKVVYVLGSATELFKLLNNWNRLSEGYIYWTEDV